jgi:hypothetical protein
LHVTVNRRPIRHREPEAVVAEYGNRFEADVAAACLHDHGIACFVRFDPAHSVAPHLVTMPGFRLVTPVSSADDARVALGLDAPPDLEAEMLDRAFYRVPFRWRPRWVRWLGIAAIVAVAAPVAITAIVLVVTVLLRLAPG